ncbi:MAG: putative DNA binding domain-containing protein [Phycisphaerales bacterium]|nr:putative DNA binding domain-containing protein [Phycisphaerales bacterium]
MRSATELISELNAVDESTTIEAKAGSDIGRSIIETVCAFANEPGLGGGYLLLGVERQAGGLFDTGYLAVGLSNPDKVQADLVTQCREMLNRPIRPQVKAETIDGKVVVVAFVPEAAAAEKPIYLPKLGLPRGAFRRVGSTDHQGTEDDLIALYAGHQTESYDSTPIHDTELSDIDAANVAEYRQMRERANDAAEELDWPDEDLLRALGCLVRGSRGLTPTAAGILLFGTGIALRRVFPMMRIDYIRVPGREWVQDPEHRFDTIEIRAPLIPAIRRATNAALDDIPKSFSLPGNDIQSTESPILPTRVIREAVVNAVMHRSYRIQGPIQIIRYANRIEIRNPGHSLKSEDELGEPGSRTRNPYIAAVLHDVNIAETKGSGIRVMRDLMQRNNLLPPTLESMRQPDQFVATFLFHHFLGPDDVVWLSGLMTEKLSDEEARALIFVREVGAIDNAAYREINGVETLDASSHLRRLRDLNLLDKKGAGNRTYYAPGPRFSRSPETEPQGPGSQSQEPPGQSQEPPGQSQEPPGQSQEPSRQSQELSARKRGAPPPRCNRFGLPSELHDRIGSVPKRPKQAEFRKLILQLCAWQPLTSAQLAELLGRQQHPLVRDHLRPMVESGDLEYTIPEMPNHPDQCYRTLFDGCAGPVVE